MKKEEKNILAEARTRFDIVCSANGELEEEFKADVSFIAGEQYTDQEKQQRLGRPCIVVNKVYAYAN